MAHEKSWKIMSKKYKINSIRFFHKENGKNVPWCRHATFLPTNGCSHLNNIPFLHINQSPFSTYFENCARQRNLTNHFSCFILEFSAFKIVTLKEVFDVVRKTFQISSLLQFSTLKFKPQPMFLYWKQETNVNFSWSKGHVCQLS